MAVREPPDRQGHFGQDESARHHGCAVHRRRFENARHEVRGQLEIDALVEYLQQLGHAQSAVR